MIEALLIIDPKERIELHSDSPLLSCADIESLLAHFLPMPRRDVGTEEVERQIRIRKKR